MSFSPHVVFSPSSARSDVDPDVEVSSSVDRAQFAARTRRAAERTRQWLLNEQHVDGYWVGELVGDTILESEYILLLAYLGRHDSPMAKKMARYLLTQQMPSGGWTTHPGGEIEISASVKAYFALKLTGHDPSAEYMQRARNVILAHGGADAVNSFTRYYLALLGQIAYDQCPAVPPEALLLPAWFPVSLYAVSAWSRTIIVPLSVMSACKPITKVDSTRGIRELFLNRPEHWPKLRCPGLKGGTGLVSWDRFFRVLDGALKWFERHRVLPFRRRALAAAEQWVIDRFEGSDGLGAIFPPMVWSVIALKCLGYDDDSPQLRYCHEQLEGLLIEEGDTIRVQPCKSPVWDTAITLRALREAGITHRHPAAARAEDWLLSKEVRRKGDWASTVEAEPSGWCFEHANEFYPDLDDTAMVVMALASRFGVPHKPDRFERTQLELVTETTVSDREEAELEVGRMDRSAAAIRRSLNWIEAMQNQDGGWGAFDRNNNHEFLCYVPFADHNAMIDPSTPDLTGRVLEALGQLGRRTGDPVVDRGVKYLRANQEADGSWFGRWGVNYVYGTWQAITGLRAVGVPVTDPAINDAANWLIAYQQPNGGWGESPDSYQDRRLRGQGPVTASQTAWALLGLLSAGRADHPAVRRGMKFLIDEQRQDGTWEESEFTGTGFPRVFYLRYDLYRIYFPLMALTRWLAATGHALEEKRHAAAPHVG